MVLLAAINGFSFTEKRIYFAIQCFQKEMLRRSPLRISPLTLAAGALGLIAVFFVNIFGQNAGTLADARDIFSLILAVAGFITLAAGIIYAFFKKQKYENLERDRDEWKGLAESREERIRELKLTHSESEAKWALKYELEEKDKTVLKESNLALVSQSLQIKAILKMLRLSGKWDGHEDRIHETRFNERRKM